MRRLRSRLAPVSAALATGYLVGSLPVVYLLGRLAGVDLRRHGSATVGSHNLSAVAGYGAGLVGWLSDAAKGSVVVLSTRRLACDEALAGWSLIGALAGQCWPVFLGWRGGRGVATLVGGIVTLTPGIARWPLGVIAAIAALRPLARTSGPIGAALRRGAVPVGVLVGALVWPLACALDHRRPASTTTALAACMLLLLRRISANVLPKTASPPISLLSRVWLDRDHW